MFLRVIATAVVLSASGSVYAGENPLDRLFKTCKGVLGGRPTSKAEILPPERTMQWIAVEDERPETSERVVFLRTESNLKAEHHLNDGIPRRIWRLEVGAYDPAWTFFRFGENVSHWFPVPEETKDFWKDIHSEFPSKNEAVLLRIENDVAKHPSMKPGSVPEFFYKVAIYNKRRFYHFWEGQLTDNEQEHITHWMPIPQLPADFADASKNIQISGD